MGANTTNVTLAIEADPSNIKANDRTNPSNIIATLTDINGNPVSGMPVYFERINVTNIDGSPINPDKLTAGAVFGTDLLTGLITATATTLDDGTATAIMIGAYGNQVMIKARYNTLMQQQTCILQCRPGNSEVSNYPNPFRAGTGAQI